MVLTSGHCAEEIGEETVEIIGTTEHAELERPSTVGTNGGEGFDPKGTGSEGDIDFAVINVDASKCNVKAAASDWTSAGSDDLSTSVKDLKSVGTHTDVKIQKSGCTTGLTEDDLIVRE